MNYWLDIDRFPEIIYHEQGLKLKDSYSNSIVKGEERQKLAILLHMHLL